VSILNIAAISGVIGIPHNPCGDEAGPHDRFL